MAKPGSVYVIKPKFKDGPYKIGFTTTDLTRRLQNIQTGAYEELEVVAVIQSAEPKQLEQSIHKLFRQEWIRGEWFAASRRLYDYLMSLPGVSSPIGPSLRKLNTIPNRSWHASSRSPVTAPSISEVG